MTSTVFSSGTVITAPWLNDVNTAVYTTVPNNTAAIASQSNASGVSYNEGGTGAVTTTVQAKLQQTVSVMDFGAKGDGTTDDTAAIQATMNAGAGNKVYIPANTYKITNTIFVSSGTFVEWAGTFVVYGIDASYQCAITGNTGATNITYFNPQINLNSYVPASGILVGTNQDQVRIIGGLIQNGLNSTSQTGGRGISIEQGASATVPSNTTVTGTNIMNCFEGISLSGGTGQEKNNVSISNLTISGCQSAIGFSGNAAGYPHAGSSMQFTLSNISIRNCGIQTVYGQSAGVINSNRGSNILFSNIYCFNDSSYGTVGSFWRGDAANVKMINCTFEGNTSIALLDFSSYQESSSYPLAAYSSTGSDFTTITQKGTSPIVINLPISSASYLTNCRFDLITQTITSGAPCTTNTDNKTTCYMTIQNSTSNAIIEGYLSDIHSGTTFAQYANMQYFASQIGVARAFGVFAGSTGTLNHGLNATVTRTATGTYTVAFANPLPTTGYAVFVQATPTNTTNVQTDYAANIANTGFTIYTYSNNALVDKSLVNFSVFY